MGSFIHLHWLHNDLIASRWQLPFNKVCQIARKFPMKWEPEGTSWANRALYRWYTMCIPISIARMGPQAQQVLGTFMMTSVSGPLYMASAHGFVKPGSFGSHLGGIFHALWSTSLTYLTHGNKKTNWTLTIDAISLLNYRQLSTRTHTHRHKGECLSCLLYSRRKRDHLRTHGSPVQTITNDFPQTNVQMYSFHWLCVSIQQKSQDPD